jgi:putative flippase GtrA
METKGILLATAMGFLSGLLFNYIFSIIFVFRTSNAKAKQHKFLSFLAFAVIGIIGLGLTELCMIIGINIFGQDFYLIIKIITAGIMFVWNYGARKILIFRGEKNENTEN